MHKDLVAVKKKTGAFEFSTKESKEGTTGPVIGHVKKSCTTYPETFLTSKGLAFCDTAGFFDTRSKEHEQSAFYALDAVLSVANSVKAILFVCDFSTMNALRGAFFTKAVELLSKILKTSEEYGRSVFFVITKVRMDEREAVMETIKEMKEEFEKQDETKSVARLLELLVENPNSVIMVSPEDLIGTQGLDFGTRMCAELQKAKISRDKITSSGLQAGQEEYLDAYEKLKNEATHQINSCKSTIESLDKTKADIKATEGKIPSESKSIQVTEEKLTATRQALADEEKENERTLKLLHEELKAVPDEINRLKEHKCKECEEYETHRYNKLIEEIKLQNENNSRNRQINVEKLKKQTAQRIIEEAKRKDGDITRNQQKIREELQREQHKEEIRIQREIELKTENYSNRKASKQKEIEALEADLKRHKQNLSDYRNKLEQDKSKYQNLLEEIHSVFTSFTRMKPVYDAMIGLFKLLRLSDKHHALFMKDYPAFLETLFPRVNSMIEATSVIPESKEQDMILPSSMVTEITISIVPESKRQNMVALPLPMVKADGDCAFHAIFGTWSNTENKIVCVDAEARRKVVQKAIAESKTGSRVRQLAIAGIKELIMTGRVIGERSKQRMVSYQQFLREQHCLSPHLWETLESVIQAHPIVMDYITANHRHPEGASALLRDQFYDALNRNEGELYGIVRSLPNLDAAFKRYNELNQISYDWDSVSADLLIEYAQFVGRPQQWLLASEIAILAEVFETTVEYYSAPDANKEIFNPGKEKRVAIQFNGRDHFEQRREESKRESKSASLSLNNNLHEQQEQRLQSPGRAGVFGAANTAARSSQTQPAKNQSEEKKCLVM